MYFLCNQYLALLVSNVPYRLVQKIAVGPDISRILSAFSPHPSLFAQIYEGKSLIGVKDLKRTNTPSQGRKCGSEQEVFTNAIAGRVSPPYFSTWFQCLSLSLPDILCAL